MLLSVLTFQISFFVLLIDYARMQKTNDAISLQDATCPRGQFTCDSSQCIDELKLCDGTADCKDNSDETIDACLSEKCPDQSFKCEYACIHINGRCNGHRDCFDWSDEESCPYTKSFDYIGCELPDNPRHGGYAVISHLWNEYHSGDIIPTYGVLSLSCHKGYAINPPDDDGLSYCLPTRELMPVPKTCVRKSLFSAGCRLPNNPSNGKYVVINHVSAGYKPGDIVPVFSILIVNCDNGYKGNPLDIFVVSYCLATEEWSPTPNTCTVKPILSDGCQIPNNPSYGRYSIESDLELPSRLKSDLTSGDAVPVHTKLSLKCFKGYKVYPSDDELSDCTSTREWSPAPKTCVLPDPECQVPSNPLHGKYVVITPSSSYDDEEDDEDLEEDTPADIVPLHSLLSLKCNKGYEVNPSTDGETSNCTSAGKWDPSPKTCFQGCPVPDNPLNGKYVVKYDKDQEEEYYPGDLAPMNRLLFVNCNNGYKVSPSPDDEPSKCTSAGKWVPSPKTCFQGCRIPDNLLIGKYLVQHEKNHYEVYYPGNLVPMNKLLFVSCHNGYEVSLSPDDEPSNCTSSGKWDPFPKSCFQGCLVPDNPLNGELAPVNRLLFVNCNNGYEVSPSPDDEPSNCTSTGIWVPSPKICLQGCRFPNHPLNGKYMVKDDKTEYDKYHPGDIISVNRSLSVHCNKGYEVSSSADDESPNCTSTGKWIPAPKTCARACPVLVSTDTTNVVCEFDGKLLNSCSNAVENSIARLSCAPFYEESNLEKYPTRSCHDGSWKYPIPQCYPICGKINSSDFMNNTRTYNTYKDSVIFKSWFPWYVDVYRKVHDLESLKYTCRGSIIKERIVLSAARCFADDQGKKYEIEDFYITANRSYFNPRHINNPYSRVHAIHIPESFKGEINYYEADIAIIILSTPFQLTANVQPVCIDLETEHDEKSIDYGKVTGLGALYDKNEDKLSEVFNKEIFSVLPYSYCSEKVYEEYRKYITYDKICLNYIDIDAAIICIRPSGSALAYLKESTDRYFVRGIASKEFQRNSNANLCSLAYTSIDHHIAFIRKLITLYSTAKTQ